MELQADRQGHYRIDGTINAHPASFLVDTGASSVVISRKYAHSAGIHHCTLGKLSHTANGVVEVCTATGNTIEFGPFRLTDVEIDIVPNMAVDALLGMSVLRGMEIRQADGIMRLGMK